MAHYVIGDVQVCVNELEELISKFGFDPNKDKIIFAGDLVNRGENSLGVLDFCLKYKDSTHAVLGNHDFYLMHLIASNGDDEHLQEILNSPNLDKFYEWLKQLPLFKEIKINKTNNQNYNGKRRNHQTKSKQNRFSPQGKQHLKTNQAGGQEDQAPK